MRTWDSINNCPSYKFTCEPNELYEDNADLLLQRRCLRSHYNEKTTNTYYFHYKSDLDTQINTSDRLQNKQIIFSQQVKPAFRGYLSFDGSEIL